MAKKLSSDELKAIIAKDRPGYQIVEPTPIPDTAMSDNRVNRSASNLDRLRQKFLGVPASDSTMAPASAGGGPAPAQDDTEIVQIAPQTDTSRSKRKAAIISGREKKIIGEQG